MNNTNYEYTLYSTSAFGINLATVTLAEMFPRFYFWRDLSIEELNLFIT